MARLRRAGPDSGQTPAGAQSQAPCTRSDFTCISRSSRRPFVSIRRPTYGASRFVPAPSINTIDGERFLRNPDFQLLDFGASSPDTFFSTNLSSSRARQPAMVAAIATVCSGSGCLGSGVGSSVDSRAAAETGVASTSGATDGAYDNDAVRSRAGGAGACSGAAARRGIGADSGAAEDNSTSVLTVASSIFATLALPEGRPAVINVAKISTPTTPIRMVRESKGDQP